MADALISVGSSGTMVAAVLETGGFIFQSFVLDELTPSLKGSVGGFIYLIGIVLALFNFAVKGNYRLVSWLLIGPPMFFSVILPRTATENARWQFAKEDRTQSYVDAGVRRMYEKDNPGDAGKKEVSTLFAKYNKMVSLTIQEIIAVINHRQKDRDKMFIFRGQLYGKLYSSYVEDTAFKDFIQAGMFGACADFVKAARVLKNDQSTATQRQLAQSTFDNKFETARTITLTPKAALYLASKDLKGISGNPSDPETPPNDQAEAFLNDKIQYYKQFSYTCSQIWNDVHDGIEEYAKGIVENINGLAVANKIDQDELSKELERAAIGSSATDYTAKLEKLVALYVLKNEFYRGSNTNFLNKVSQQARAFDQVELQVQDDLMLTENSRIAIQEYSEKTRLLHAASNLPYYQGLALFFLGSFFPFFALLLLVPGKHAGFLHWFMLWLWVKSWDVGFAVVILLDDVLFGLFSVAKEEINKNGERLLSDDFAQTMYSLTQVDPTFQMGTYYNILAVAMLSIPVISSQLILGSVSGGASIISAGMNTLGTAFARTSQVSAQQQAITSLKQEIYANQLESAYAASDARFGRKPISPMQRAKFAASSTAADKAFRQGELQKMLSAADPADKKGIPGSTKYVGELGRVAGSGAADQHLKSAVQLSGDSGRLSYSASGLQKMSGVKRLKAIGGLANEVGNPQGGNFGRLGSNIYGRRIRSSVIGEISAPVGQIASELAAIDAAYLEAELGVEAAFSYYDLLYGEHGKLLERKARIWGMLEVSWAQVDDSSTAYQKVAEYEYSIIDNQLKMASTVLRAASGSLKPGGGIRDFRTNIRKSILGVGGVYLGEKVYKDLLGNYTVNENGEFEFDEEFSGAIGSVTEEDLQSGDPSRIFSKILKPILEEQFTYKKNDEKMEFNDAEFNKWIHNLYNKGD